MIKTKRKEAVELLYLVLVLVGVGIGTIITTFRTYKKPVGTLRVDHSDDEPYLFLEVSRDAIYKIVKMDQVTLNVKIKNYISHE